MLCVIRMFGCTEHLGWGMVPPDILVCTGYQRPHFRLTNLATIVLRITQDAIMNTTRVTNSFLFYLTFHPLSYRPTKINNSQVLLLLIFCLLTSHVVKPSFEPLPALFAVLSDVQQHLAGTLLCLTQCRPWLRGSQVPLPNFLCRL